MGICSGKRQSSDLHCASLEAVFWLRLLDDDKSLNEKDDALLHEAQAMTRYGYREILRLAEPGADTK